MKGAPRRLSRRPSSACRARLAVEHLEDRTLLSHSVLEIEPNNSVASANLVPLGFDLGEESALTVAGAISTPGDQDWFKIELNAGDVIGGTVAGSGGLNSTVGLVNSAGTTLYFNDDHGHIDVALPPESPLPRISGTNGYGEPKSDSGNHDSAFYYVIHTAGTYFVKVADAANSGTGKYTISLVGSRPGLESKPVGTKQILFVDFDGATLTTFAGKRTLSPLSSFLAGWGLTPADENALIDGILASIKENLSTDIRKSGLNGDFAKTHSAGDFDIDIRNSRDNADQFGTNPFVSRVVIGGTGKELGFPTGGIAQWIDPGNFSSDDDAVVLLDWIPDLSSLFTIRPPRTEIELLALAIGLIASHEAGHYFGNFHTDADWQFTTTRICDPGIPNVMDQALCFPEVLLGGDGVFGPDDHGDYDFGVDRYVDGIISRDEGIRGIQDTLNVIAFGLSTGKGTAGSSGGAGGTKGSNTWPPLSRLNSDPATFRAASVAGFDHAFTSAPSTAAIRLPNFHSVLFAVNPEQISAMTGFPETASLNSSAFPSGQPKEDHLTRSSTPAMGSTDRIQLLSPESLPWIRFSPAPTRTTIDSA